MNRLQIFYRKWMQIIVIVIATIGVFIGRDVILYIETTLSKSLGLSILAKFLTSSIFFTILYFVFEYLVREHLWKISIFNRDIDFSGKWLGWTFYTNLEIESSEVPQNSFKPFSSSHRVIIDQNCLNIKITPSPGSGYVKWGSIAIDITENKTLLYAYEVTYQGDERLKDKALGYEEMDIIKTCSIKDKHPILMSGSFYHCATGKRPIYRGNTIFVRANYANLINKDDLPGFATGIYKEMQQQAKI